jgi:UDP-glucose 4-epimerase
VVECVIRLTETPAAVGSVYNIGSDEPISIKQLAEEVIRRANPGGKIEFIPYGAAYGDDFEDVRRRVPDVTRLERTIGLKPKLPLSAILDDIIRWKREQRNHSDG